MKRIFAIILFIFQIVMISAKVGDNMQVDGIWYTITTDATADDFGKVKVGKIVTTTNGHQMSPMDKSGDLIIPEYIVYANHMYIVEAIGEYAFNGSKNLHSVYLPHTIKKIFKNAFTGCSSLAVINLSNVINIGDNVFENCTDLKNISFCQEEQVEISSSAFSGCESLKELTFNNVKLGGYTFSNCVNLEKVTFTGSADLSGNSMFSGCNSLSTIIISPMGYKIGSSTFSNIPSLEYFYYPSTEVEYVVEYISGASYYPNNYTFKNTNPNATLFVSEGMRDAFKKHSVWSKAFKYIVTTTPLNGEIFGSTINAEEEKFAIELEVINANQNQVQIIYAESFSQENLIIPNIVTLDKLNFELSGIHENVFKGSEIKSLVIDEGIEYVGKECFAQCVNLESIILPRSLKTISNSFVGCNNIKEVVVSWRDPNEVAIDSANFLELPKDAVLEIPAGTFEKYQSHPVWRRFSNIIESSPISVSSIDILSYDKGILPICLRNEEDIAGIQFKLTLPNGMYIDETDITSAVTERTNDMFVLSHIDPDSLNTYNFIMVSFDEKCIQEGSGEILNLKFYSQGMPIGIYEIDINDISISTPKYETNSLPSSNSEISVIDILPGDANGDGTVAVNDAVYTVNKILGAEAADFKSRAADMNNDGNILVNDVVLIVNTILGINTTTASLAPRYVNAYETLSVTDSKNNYVMAEFGVSLSNAGRYTAIQFDMQVADAADVTDIRTSSSATNHNVAFRMIDDTTVRVVVTSLTNEALADGIQLCVSMKNTAGSSISFINGKAACNNGQMVDIMPSSSMLSGTTGINGINADFSPVDIYDLTGKIVKKGATSLDGLKRGVYVINGQKIIK